MRLFDIMVLLILIGCVSGALDYIMGFDENWMEGYASSDLTTVVVLDGDISNFDVKNVSSPIGAMEVGFNSWNLLIKSISGVFHMNDMLGKIFKYSTPSNPSENLFEPILDLIQGVINLIVVFGIYQGITGRTTKHME